MAGIKSRLALPAVAAVNEGLGVSQAQLGLLLPLCRECLGGGAGAAAAAPHSGKGGAPSRAASSAKLQLWSQTVLLKVNHFHFLGCVCSRTFLALFMLTTEKP